MNIFLIAIGGAIGSVLRFLLSTSVYNVLGRMFPYGTLVVNASGCFVMGFLSIIVLERFNNFAGELRSLLLIGFLGGFTTFSSFALETLNLFEDGATLNALLNIILSVVMCMVAVWLGVQLGREV